MWVCGTPTVVSKTAASLRFSYCEGIFHRNLTLLSLGRSRKWLLAAASRLQDGWLDTPVWIFLILHRPHQALKPFCTWPARASVVPYAQLSLPCAQFQIVPSFRGTVCFWAFFATSWHRGTILAAPWNWWVLQTVLLSCFVFPAQCWVYNGCSLCVSGFISLMGYKPGSIPYSCVTLSKILSFHVLQFFF